MQVFDKVKDPARLIGHGVWTVVGKTCSPVKVKIERVTVIYGDSYQIVEEAKLSGRGYIPIVKMFATKKEAYIASEELVISKIKFYSELKRQFPGKEKYGVYVEELQKRLACIEKLKGEAAR